MSWSREQVQLLIDLFKQHPCLYAVKDKKYSNKHARNDALSVICQEMTKVRPGTQIVDCKNKFANLRTNFLNQHRKYSSSISSGMGEDEINKPTLWYYDEMMFILEHTTPRESIDSLSQTCLHVKTATGYDELNIDEELFSPPLRSTSSLSFHDSEDPPENDPAGDVNHSRASTSKNINIQSIHTIMNTPSTSSPNDHNMKASSKRKRKFDEDNIIKAAVDSLRGIGKAISSNTVAVGRNTVPSTEQQNASQSEVFANFIAKQMLCIEQQNEELFIDVQNQISNIIYNARKELLNTN